MHATKRIGFGLEFGYPALLMIVIAAAPTAVLTASERLSPETREFIVRSHTTDSVLNFLVHTWGIFFLVLAGIIFTIGTMQHLLGNRIKRMTAPTGTH